MTGGLTVDSVRAELRTDLAQILYCETADIHDTVDFVALGLDSVLGLEFLVLLNSRYRLQENIDSIYDHPTVDRLAAYLCERVTARAADA